MGEAAIEPIDLENRRKSLPRQDSNTLPSGLRKWDVFCRVVDNYGDIGTCWRLAQQLASQHGATVRLWVDDLASFACLCPSISIDAPEQSLGPIRVCHWSSGAQYDDVADVVVEAFACDLPTNYVEKMAQRNRAPVWINLEYLSAEDWVEDCHLLSSPHPVYRLTKYFFFPGFTSRTGGLLREDHLLDERTAFDGNATDAFWQSVDIPPQRQGEIRISLFCYDNPGLSPLLNCWSDSPLPVRILAAPGAAAQQIGNWFGQRLIAGTPLISGSLTVNGMPFLEQSRYDHLLWSCDMNFVRGEDSFVRAQWAQRPFVWQIYPQTENTHRIKLDAYLARYLTDSSESAAFQRFWHAWNGFGDISAAWPDFMRIRHEIERHTKVWVRQLDRMENLAHNLVRFVRGK